MPYISLADQGFWDPFKMGARGLAGIVDLYDRYKPGGQEDERRQRMDISRENQDRQNRLTDWTLDSGQRRDMRDQALFDQTMADRQDAKIKAQTPGFISTEALRWPVQPPVAAQPAVLSENRESQAVASPGGGTMLLPDTPFKVQRPASLGQPEQRQFFNELPDYQQQNLVNKYGLGADKIATDYDAAVTSATGRVPNPHPLPALPITVADPTGGMPTKLGYQIGNQFVPNSKTDLTPVPINLPGANGQEVPVGVTIGGKFVPYPKAALPPAPPTVFPVQDPTTGKPLGNMVGNTFVKAGEDGGKPSKIRISEKGADGRTITREVTPDEYDQIQQQNEDDQWFNAARQQLPVVAYENALRAWRNKPTGGTFLGMGTPNDEALNQARDNLVASGQFTQAEANYLINRLENRRGLSGQQPGMVGAFPVMPPENQPAQSTIQNNLPTVSTQEQYDALPSGALFIEDGVLYTKP
jgi:hypothetical protein